MDTYSDAKKIQRYALATVFLSTNGASWNDNSTWMSDEDECGWYNNGISLCTHGSVEALSLWDNNLVGNIPNELALLTNMSKSSVVWLLVVMIMLSCVFHCTLMLACHIHSTADLNLSGNNLTGMIPSQIALMSYLSECSVVWLLAVMIVLSCVFYVVLSCLLVIFIQQLTCISP
jgi:hypothetical protein